MLKTQIYKSTKNSGIWEKMWKNSRKRRKREKQKSCEKRNLCVKIQMLYMQWDCLCHFQTFCSMFIQETSNFLWSIFYAQDVFYSFMTKTNFCARQWQLGWYHPVKKTNASRSRSHCFWLMIHAHIKSESVYAQKQSHSFSKAEGPTRHSRFSILTNQLLIKTVRINNKKVSSILWKNARPEGPRTQETSKWTHFEIGSNFQMNQF